MYNNKVVLYIIIEAMEVGVCFDGHGQDSGCGAAMIHTGRHNH